MNRRAHDRGIYSGLGGLSVLKSLLRRLPQQQFAYFADSLTIPWGNKPQQFIIERSIAIVKFLQSLHCHIIVVACNTATASAIEILRTEFKDIKFVGVEPGVKPAVTHSAKKIIGVLATESTLKSARYEKLLSAYQAEARFISVAGIGLVEQIENGYCYAPRTHQLCAQYCHEIMHGGADELVLGCTHYSFLVPIIAQIIDKSIHIIDTAPAIAEQTARLLVDDRSGLLHEAGAPHPPQVQFWNSGGDKARAQMEKILLLLNIYQPTILHNPLQDG